MWETQTGKKLGTTSVMNKCDDVPHAKGVFGAESGYNFGLLLAYYFFFGGLLKFITGLIPIVSHTPEAYYLAYYRLCPAQFVTISTICHDLFNRQPSHN